MKDPITSTLRDQRAPANQPVRELVAVARVLARHTIDHASEVYQTRPHTALMLLELAIETERAIERLRRA